MMKKRFRTNLVLAVVITLILVIFEVPEDIIFKRYAVVMLILLGGLTIVRLIEIGIKIYLIRNAKEWQKDITQQYNNLEGAKRLRYKAHFQKEGEARRKEVKEYTEYIQACSKYIIEECQRYNKITCFHFIPAKIYHEIKGDLDRIQKETEKLLQEEQM